MRILAVSEAGGTLYPDVERRGRHLHMSLEHAILHADLLQLSGDGPVVSGSAGKGFPHQPPVGIERKVALGLLQFPEHARVVGRGHDHRDILIILGGGADHRGTADVDLLDQMIDGRTRVGSRLLERIEVHHHHVDARNALRENRRQVIWPAAHGKNSPGNCRMQRLHPPV